MAEKAAKKKAKGTSKHEEADSAVIALLSQERTKAIDELIHAAVNADLSSKDVFEAAMLGASEKGVHLAARVLLEKKSFCNLAWLADTGKFSYTTFEAIAMYVHEKKMTDCFREFSRSEVLMNGLVSVYIKRLLSDSIEKILVFREENNSLTQDEMAFLMETACDKGNIVAAIKGAEWRDKKLTKEEIIRLTKSISDKQKRSL